ncbi:MAG: hypothetical protein CFH05_00806 [Alphaproteobacteria bacterium MarineAlpha3_Bin4]|nr:MAG: hypothetical protein CFH05_00806 [Alphaproteobacteria bacterium MarineAlpha3_Bin4]
MPRGLISKVLTAALLAMELAACGELPRPFKPTYEAPPNPLVEEGVRDGIWIDVIDGLSSSSAKLLATSVVRELNKRDNVAVSGQRVPLRFVLKGEAVRNTENVAVTSMFQIHWTLLDVSGSQVGHFYHRVPGTNLEWEYGSPRTIRLVGKQVAEAILAMIKTEERRLAAIKSRAAGLWINPIKGAPGDGDRALTQAIRQALRGAGTEIVGLREKAHYVLEGVVRVDPPKDGAQGVRIDWIISNVRGAELGRATQMNKVAAGTFDRSWGQVATLVAMAAVGGIQDVINNDTVQSGGENGRMLETDLPLGYPAPPLPKPELLRFQLKVDNGIREIYRPSPPN